MKNEVKKKIYVLDTNIVADDAEAIFGFKDNIVVLPSIIRSEADKLKKRQHDEVGYQIRNFISILNNLSKKCNLVVDGYKTKEGGIIYESYDYGDKDGLLKYAADLGPNDISILKCCKVWQNRYPDKKVVLITLDVNLESAARINSIDAEPRTKDAVELDEIYEGYRYCPYVELLADTYQKKSKEEERVIEIGSLKQRKYINLAGSLKHNEYVVFADHDERNRIEEGRLPNVSTVFRFDRPAKILRSIKYRYDKKILGIVPKNIEQLLAIDLGLDENITLAAYFGKARTGKTYVAVALALHYILERNRKGIKTKLYLTKPHVAVAGEESGFLPGTLLDKRIGDYRGVDKNLQKIMPYLGTEALRLGGDLKEILEVAGNLIEILPIADIRGFDLSENEFWLIEESQNMTIPTLKTTVTRGGDNSKTFYTGDPWQPDHPMIKPEINGLSHLINVMSTSKQEKYNFFGAMKFKQVQRGGKQAEWGANYL